MAEGGDHAVRAGKEKVGDRKEKLFELSDKNGMQGSNMKKSAPSRRDHTAVAIRTYSRSDFRLNFPQCLLYPLIRLRLRMHAILRENEFLDS